MTTTVDDESASAVGTRRAAIDSRSAIGRRSLRQRVRLPLMFAGPFVVLLAAGYWYLTGGRYVSTDDAYVQAARVAISTDISGRVVEIDVTDNERVDAGQVLFRLDPRPFRIAVEEAKAQLATVRFQIHALKATYHQKRADARATEAMADYQQHEFERQQRLLASGTASQQQFEQAKQAFETGRQQLASKEQDVATALASLGGDPDIPLEQHPMVQHAQAALDRAELNLSYAEIHAPENGIVTKVDQLQVGDYVNASTPLFSLMSTDRVWVEANFKETELTHMRPGQTATVEVDTYPDVVFPAKVESLSPGHRAHLLAAAGRERDRQLGEGRPASAGTPQHRPFRAGGPAPRRVECDRGSRHRAPPPLAQPGRAALCMARGFDDASRGAVRGETPTPVANRGAITASIMLATFMQGVDTTIANVALPHMQGSFSAAQDQIAWVITSYIVAAAIMTPLTGWLAARFGIKYVFLISVAGFTLASALCGLATNLAQMVIYRLLQGICGAALVPLSQSVLLQINPPDRHARAMSVWGMGVILGPIIGPALGGWLTDEYNWRWVFFINVPFGLLAAAGILTFIRETRHAHREAFDFFGFATLSLAIGALQMFLDRGELKDWFGSTEIWVEATIAGLAFYLFVVHTATATDRSFLNRDLLKDTNCAVGTILMFLVAIPLFGTMVLLPTMLQDLLNYPVLTTGLVLVPRGLGTMASMFIVGRLIGRVDTRLVILAGLILTAVALWQMTGFSLVMGMGPVISTGLLQGFGLGLVFTPLSIVTFSTLPRQILTQGTAIFSLTRNIGSSVGIAIVEALLVENTQVVHSRLVEQLRPDNPLARMPHMAAPFSLTDPSGLAALNAEATRQAAMVAYIDDFMLMTMIVVVGLPLLLLLRRPSPATSRATVAAE